MNKKQDQDKEEDDDKYPLRKGPYFCIQSKAPVVRGERDVNGVIRFRVDGGEASPIDGTISIEAKIKTPGVGGEVTLYPREKQIDFLIEQLRKVKDRLRTE